MNTYFRTGVVTLLLGFSLISIKMTTGLSLILSKAALTV